MDAAYVQTRLGDPHYQLLDVRSPEEYRGVRVPTGLAGEQLKAGHIPTAANVDYRLAWLDPTTKAFKPYPQLLELYRGLDPSKTVIVYCQSGRRASFGYFTLRLMGFESVALYDASWFEWGNPRTYFPIETEEHRFSASPAAAPFQHAATERIPGSRTQAPVKGGYVSCGG